MNAAESLMAQKLMPLAPTLLDNFVFLEFRISV